MNDKKTAKRIRRVRQRRLAVRKRDEQDASVFARIVKRRKMLLGI